MKYRNLADLFFKRAEKYLRRPIVRYRKRRHLPYEEITWQEAKENVEQIAYGLKALGLRKGQNVGLLATTCHLWMFCDFGILSAGCCTVPIYHSSLGDSVKFIVDHAELEVVIVSNKIQLQKLRALWHTMPKLRYVIVMVDSGDIPTNDPRILTLEELMKIGRKEQREEPNFIQDRLAEVESSDIATIIYTSGTTGIPKGVVLTHEHVLVAAMSFYQYVPFEEGYNMLSFLPLAHVFERVCCQFYGIDQGVIFTYCEKIEELPSMLKDADVDTMTVVPRILEKIHARIMAKSGAAGPIKKKMFDEAIRVGKEYHRKKVNKEHIPQELRIAYEVAQMAVLSKIKEQIAPNLKVFIVGGAPFSPDLSYFYMAIGFNIVEGYGLTETTAPISVNPPWANKPGTVGIPFSHFEVKIADDGEIICRGPAVFTHYYKNPEATAEAIIDGWFHTGDLGAFDADGYLSITGRKKDLLITAAGKNVAPQHVEALLLRSKYLNQIVVLGDKEKYLAALIVLNEDEVRKHFADLNIELPPRGSNLDQVPQIRALVDQEIARNSLDLASYEQIKAYSILDHELTIESGELTPTLKIKRNVVRERYPDLIKPLFRKEKTAS